MEKLDIFDRREQTSYIKINNSFTFCYFSYQRNATRLFTKLIARLYIHNVAEIVTELALLHCFLFFPHGQIGALIEVKNGHSLHTHTPELRNRIFWPLHGS